MRTDNYYFSIVSYIIFIVPRIMPPTLFVFVLAVVPDIKNKVCFALEFIFVFVHTEILFQNLFVSQLCIVFLQNVFQKVHNRGFFKFIFHKVAAEIIVFHVDRRRIFKAGQFAFKHADCAVAKYVVDGNFAVSDGKCGGVRYAAHNRAGCHGFAVLVFFVNVFDNAVFVLGRVLFKRARVNAIAVFVICITARRAFSYRRVLDIKVGSRAEFGLAEIIPYCIVFLFNIGTVQVVSVAKLRIIATGKIIIPVFSEFFKLLFKAFYRLAIA